jgi:PadR family transcriptional regulator PadR
MSEAQALEGLKQELRRGTLVLGVLAALRTERYGYTLRDTLAKGGIEIDEGPLYPMLRRLEAQGLLTSEWREEGKRNKRFYALSKLGSETLRVLETEWRAMNGSLEKLLKEKTYEPA